MASPIMPIYSTFAVGRATAAGGTEFAKLIPPFQTEGAPANGVRSPGITHVSKLCYTTGATAHQIGIMRPFNFTTFSADAAAGQKVVNITADPGLYSTVANWKYSPVPNAVPRIANNAIAASDYVAYQCADGSYVIDTVASVATLAVTLTTNVPTGGVKSGGQFYFLGVIGDSDPSTADVNPQTTTVASAAQAVYWSDPIVGVVQAVHAGDPLMFYSPNTTNAGVLEFLCGFHGMR